MPRIRQVVSEQQPGVVRLPRNIPVATAQELGIGAAQAVEQFGGQLGEIAKKVQDTADELEVSQRRGEYDAAVADLQEQVKLEPDTFEQPAIFKRNLADLQNNILENTERAPVAQTLQKYFNLTGPVAVVDVQATAITIANDKQINLLNEQADSQSKIAARTEDPDERGKIMDSVAAIATRMAERGQMSFAAAGNFKRGLAERVILDRMKILAETDRPKLRAESSAGLYDAADPVKRLAILKIADANDVREGVQANKALKEARSNELRDFYRRAKLPESDANHLKLDDVLASTTIEFREMDFFDAMLRKTTDPKTDRGTLISITDLLDARTNNREQEIENATRAIALAKDAYINKETLAKTDTLNIITRGNKIIEGEDPTRTLWFRLAKEFLKNKFGWTGGEFGQWLNPEKAGLYFELYKTLLAEVEAEGGPRGQAIQERAEELARPHILDMLDETPAALEPGAGFPDPTTYEPNSEGTDDEGRVWTNGPKADKWVLKGQ